MTTLKLHGIVPVKTCDPWYAKGLGPEVGHAETIKRTNPDTIRGLGVNHAEDKAIVRAMRSRDVQAKRKAGGTRGKSRAWVA